MAHAVPVPRAGAGSVPPLVDPTGDPTGLGQELSLGLRSLRLVVLFFVLLDVISSLVATSATDQSSALAILTEAIQSLVIVSALAAVMWGRRVLGLVLLAAVVVLTLTVGPRGDETTLLLIVVVVATARLPWRQVWLSLGLVVAWSVVFGLHQERNHQGWGPGAVALVLIVGAVGTGIGLVVRALLARDRRRRLRLAQLERENADIAVTERRRLADELQVLVVAGLSRIEAEIDELSTRGSQEAAQLQTVLGRVDALSRGLLTQLRTLLEVLRSEPDRLARASVAAAPEGGLRWLRVRTVRIAATVVFAAVALRAAAAAVAAPQDPGIWVQVLALAACGSALWRPWGTRVAAVVAALSLVLAVASGSDNGWDALPVALLCLIGTARVGVRRVWLVLVGLVGYGVVRATLTAADQLILVPIAYAGLVGTLAGLAISDFWRAQESSEGRQQELFAERARLESDERNALARELHDVVAHQLSVVTMVALGATGSSDPAVLERALDRVDRSTHAARSELDVLLLTMRGVAADQVHLAPLTSPLTTAEALERQLRDAGHHPEMDVDRAADALDPSLQRTLTRIMQEATTNILRYAPDGSACQYVLHLDPGAIDLSVSSPLVGRPRRSALSLGWGLRGVQERVELTRGTFRAGPDHGRWSVRVTLPNESDPRASAALAALAVSTP